jgi:hypothetical protein
VGHIHLGTLPRTRNWQDVVALLTGGGSNDAVVAATAFAAEREFEAAARDPVYVEAVRLLFVVPTAAREQNFAAALTRYGIQVRPGSGLLDILVAISARVDVVARDGRGRTDLGELAGRALAGTLSVMIGDRLPGLFDADADDVRNAARALARPDGISTLVRAFYGRLVSDSLSYWLDRRIATFVGEGARFATAADRTAFDAALIQYASETTRIIKEFASGWYAKHIIPDGRIDSTSAAVFGAVALKKIVSELSERQADHD